MGLKESMNKKFKEGIIYASDEGEYEHKAWLSTGNLALDLAISFHNKGAPSSALIENYGDSATGKSVMAYHLLKEAQEQGGTAVLIDMEHAFTAKLGRSIGLDLEKLIIVQATTTTKLKKRVSRASKNKAKTTKEVKKEETSTEGNIRPLCLEEVFQRVEHLIHTVHQQYGKDHLLCIAWDSIGNTNPIENLEPDRPGVTQGVVAKRVGNWVERITPVVTASNTLLFLVNTVYTNITSTPTAEPLKSKHGKGIKFNSQIRIQWFAKLGKAGKILDSKGNESGARLFFKITKNREQRGWLTGTVDWNFSLTGEPSLDYYSGLIDFLVKYGKLEKGTGCVKIGGSTYKCRNVGTSNTPIYEANVEVMEKMLKEHPELLER